MLLLWLSRVSPPPCNAIDGSPQAPPSLGFSRQEYWSGLPWPSPRMPYREGLSPGSQFQGGQ